MFFVRCQTNRLLHFFFFLFSPVTKKKKSNKHYLGFKFAAHFVRSKHGSRSLIVNGAKFVKDRTTNETINWRCSNFIRYKCKARAITRVIDGREMVKLSKPNHTHEVDALKEELYTETFYLTAI